MDLVVPVRPGMANDELRFAMRSWEANLQHFRQVWVVGSAPGWLRKESVRFVKLQHSKNSTKYQRTTANLRQVLAERDLSANFVFANDDMFAMEPTHIPTWHRGPIREVADYYLARDKDSNYVRGMVQTADILRSLGHRDPLSYELHVPMIVNKHTMAALLDHYSDVPVLHKRSLYANATGMAGQYHPDVKIHALDVRPAPGPWVSTSDASFVRGLAGAVVRERFTRPSSHETRVARPVLLSAM